LQSEGTANMGLVLCIQLKMMEKSREGGMRLFGRVGLWVWEWRRARATYPHMLMG